MAAQYQVDISMSRETVITLQEQGNSLYGFKAVKSPRQGGAPLVWFRTTEYPTMTQVNWQDSYQAYDSKSEIVPNAQIVVAASVNIELGQTALVNDSGAMTVEPTGVPGAISIENQGTHTWICGISQAHAGAYPPMCAFPLLGPTEDVIAPVKKVLFMFAAIPVEAATVTAKAFSDGLLIDLTESQTRAVTFDIVNRWACGGQPWCQKIPPNEDLVTLLIES